MKRGTTSIVKAMLGSLAVHKIMLGASLVWQDWVLMTGNFIIMTSNTTPTGFSLSYNFSISSGGPAYVAFDNNATNYVQDNNLGGAYLILNFPKVIKPKKVGLRTGSPSLQLIGIKEDNTEVILLSNAISNTYTIFDVPEYELKAIKLYKPSATGAGFMAIYECQITEWFQTN